MGFCSHAFIFNLVTAAAANAIVRRATSDDSSLNLDGGGYLEVGSSGRFVTQGAARGKAVNDNVVRPAMQDGPAEEALHDASWLNLCDDDYPLGVEGRTLCNNPNSENIIIEREMCLDAANRSGIFVEHSKFDIQEDGGWRYKHPQGCFKVPCSRAFQMHAAGATTAETDDINAGATAAGDTSYCYFYNPVGQPPPEGNLTGVPVCYRPKILQGSIATNATGHPEEVCNAGYQVIMDEWVCREAAKCIGRTAGDAPFVINSYVESKFEDYPEGCFVEHTTDNLYFNKKPPNWPNSPQNPVGTPVCNVSRVTLLSDWPTPAPTAATVAPSR